MLSTFSKLLNKKPSEASSTSPPPSSPSKPEDRTSTSKSESQPADGATVDQDGSDQDGSDQGKTKLDIVFLQDTTASQGPYIEAAKKAIKSICDKVSKSTEMKREDIRFGLIAFRDHPPQDKTYVTLEFGFSSDIKVMEKNLKTLKPQGGGDGPEAVTAALAGGLNMPWEVKAAKMIVLITDAPPHGIGEAHDGFDSSPDQNDPLELARQMAEQGITLFVVACEPTLSTTYKNAVDFYAALVDITGGKMLPLTLANQLGDLIAGTAIETIETEKVIQQYQKQIVDNIYSQSKSLDEVVKEMHETLQEKKVHIHKVETDNIYLPSAASESNKEVWKSAKKLSYGKSKVTTVRGARYASKSGASYEPPSRSPPSSAPGVLKSKPGWFSGLAPRAPPPAPGAPMALPAFTLPAAPGAGPVKPAAFAPPGSGSSARKLVSELEEGSAIPSTSESANEYYVPSRRLAESPRFVQPSKGLDMEQTKRVVMQSLMRSSNVTEEGMTKKSS